MWGRELAHLDLATTAGPSFKPLPVLALAPLSVLGAATPVVWMGLMRAAAVLSLMLAYRLGARLAGPLAGAVAALSLALSADLYRTALLGSAEPVLIALTLGAADRHLAGRRDWALVLIAVAGLIRPEAWVLLGALRRLRVAARAAACARSPRPPSCCRPALWLGLDWIGSGDPLHASSTATSATEGSAANAKRAGPGGRAPRGRRGHRPHARSSRRSGVALAVRRRDRPVLSLAALALGWIAVVAIMAEVGFTGTRRYLAAPAAALCVVAGVGLVWLLEAVRERRARIARGGSRSPCSRSCPRCCAPARTRACSASRAARPTSATSCVARSTAPAAARRCCAPGVRRSTRGCRRRWPGSSTCPLSGVQATWSSSRRHPHWAPPALVFRAPARLAGPRPALPAGRRTRRRDPLGALAGAARRGVSAAQALP